MSWKEEWRGLSERIDGVIAAVRLYSELTQGGRQDSIEVGEELWDNLEETFHQIIDFKSRHRLTLPTVAASRLQDWINHHHTQFRRDHNESIHILGFNGVALRASAFASFKVEFAHCLSDQQAAARSLVERAFTHLRYTIIANPDVQRSWKGAFDRNEIACEKLGAAHFLLHGIWAFKANAEGGRTDLVLQEPLKITPQIESMAEAMVLTEWKIAKTTPAALQQIDAAVRQLKRYSAEILAGFELANHRYVVVVTDEAVPELNWPQDQMDNGIHYRFRNVAVRPSVPSRRPRQEG